ncbi:MAG: hypothetical protein RLN83_00865 [Balneola sp.]
MNFDPDLFQQSILSVKKSVLIGFTIFWNVGFLAAFYFGGGGIEGMFSPLSMKIQGILCIFSSLFFISIAVLKPVQKLVVREDRMELFTPTVFYFIAFITAVLAVSRLAVEFY